MQFAGHRRLHQRAGELALAVHPTGNFVQPGKQSCKGNIQTLETEGTLNVAVVRVRIQVHVQREIAKLRSGKTDCKVGLFRLQGDLACQGIVGERLPLAVHQQLELSFTGVQEKASVRTVAGGGEIDLSVDPTVPT